MKTVVKAGRGIYPLSRTGLVILSPPFYFKCGIYVKGIYLIQVNDPDTRIIYSSHINKLMLNNY